MRARRAGSASSSSSGRGDGVDVVRMVDHEPGLAVHHRLGRAAAVARDLRDAGGGRLEEHDAEALLLEARPPVAAEHGVDVAAAVEAREVVVAHPAEHPHRRAGALDQAIEPPAVAPAAADGDGEVGVAGGELRRRPG